MMTRKTQETRRYVFLLARIYLFIVSFYFYLCSVEKSNLNFFIIFHDFNRVRVTRLLYEHCEIVTSQKKN